MPSGHSCSSICRPWISRISGARRCFTHFNLGTRLQMHRQIPSSEQNIWDMENMLTRYTTKCYKPLLGFQDVHTARCEGGRRSDLRISLMRGIWHTHFLTWELSNVQILWSHVIKPACQSKAEKIFWVKAWYMHIFVFYAEWVLFYRMVFVSLTNSYSPKDTEIKTIISSFWSKESQMTRMCPARVISATMSAHDSSSGRIFSSPMQMVILPGCARLVIVRVKRSVFHCIQMENICSPRVLLCFLRKWESPAIQYILLLETDKARSCVALVNRNEIVDDHREIRAPFRR